MISAPIPQNESARLANLRSYELLDTLPEVQFDDITQLAAEICGTPIALFSLVDEERQWFKSRVNFDVPETSRELSFCAHAILQPDLMVVPDTLLDQRFVDSPLVTSSPNIRFYAGVPLTTAEGFSIGTLCVIDRAPRVLTTQQSASLQALSRLLQTELQMRQCLLKQDNAIKTQQAIETELEKRVAVRTSQLERLNSELIQARQLSEAGLKAKSDFLVNVSHELRTPMIAILGLSELLVTSDDVTEDGKEMLSTVLEAAQSLLGIVDNLLDLSKSDSGTMALENQEFEIRKLVQHSVSVLRPEARRKQLRLSVNVAATLPLSMRGDGARVQQVLGNLLTNAVKFTQHGEITVTVQRYSGPGQPQLHFIVSDTGIGIASDQCDAIFEPFNQADNTLTRRYGGTGLGLTICHQLVDLMKGRIWVNSELGKGSEFHFTVPEASSGAELLEAS